MTRLLLAFTLLLPVALQAAGLGVYNPAQHAVNGFMPTQLPDLQLWLDASKIGLTNGASVDVWQDFSGKSNWATNGTGSKRPLVSAINGRTALSFDGVDDWLAIKDFKSMTQISVFAVFQQVNATSGQWFIEHSPNVNSNNGFYFYGTENGPWGVGRGGAVQYPSGQKDWASNTVNVATMTYDTVGRYKRNGIVYPNNTLNGTSKTNSLVTDLLYVCSRNGTSLISKLSLCEVVIITNKVSQTIETQVERYLGTKYGIVVQ